MKIFLVSGPMIDRIVVVCQTKQESLKWVEALRNQIKVCRLPIASQQLPQPPQQLPFHTPGTPAAPHVSCSPPYLQLTMWIRRKLESKILTIEILRKILKSDLMHSNAGNSFGIIFVKRQRLHKVECIIFPSREISDKSLENRTGSGVFKRELVLDYDSTDHNGFIRCFDPDQETWGLSDDEITFLLPDPSRSSSSSSTSSSTSSSSASPTTTTSTPSYISSYGIETKTILLGMT